MADEDPEYLAWIRLRRCQKCGRMPPSQAHHNTGGRGMGQRAHDHEAISLCRTCHGYFHIASGPFRTWDKQRRQQWQDDMVAHNRAIFTEEGVF